MVAKESFPVTSADFRPRQLITYRVIKPEVPDFGPRTPRYRARKQSLRL